MEQSILLNQYAATVVVNMIWLCAYAISLVYVIVSAIICFWLGRYISGFIVRKILHISMANWWYIRLYFLNCRWLWIGPLIFMVILMFYTSKRTLKRGMEYFCASLTIMTLLSEVSVLFILPTTVAILTMGYADSVAALVGNIYQKRKDISKTYSLVGSISFFVVSYLIFAVLLNHTISSIYLAFGAALVTIVEAKILPKYDNLTVPIITFGFALLATYLK